MQALEAIRCVEMFSSSGASSTLILLQWKQGGRQGGPRLTCPRAVPMNLSPAKSSQHSSHCSPKGQRHTPGSLV